MPHFSHSGHAPCYPEADVSLLNDLVEENATHATPLVMGKRKQTVWDDTVAHGQAMLERDLTSISTWVHQCKVDKLFITHHHSGFGSLAGQCPIQRFIEQATHGVDWCVADFVISIKRRAARIDTSSWYSYPASAASAPDAGAQAGSWLSVMDGNSPAVRHQVRLGGCLGPLPFVTCCGIQAGQTCGEINFSEGK